MTSRVNTSEQKILSTKPTRIICRCGTRPVAKTMALGGVATGNMKAQEAARATITDITTGESPRLLAMDRL